MPLLLELLGLVALCAGLLLVPLGLPGLWLMVAVVAVASLLDAVAWSTLAALFVLAVSAELAELAVLRSFGKRYGGSRGAFWGAVAGGLVGIVVGLPVPVVGPLVAGLVGTFAGAGAVTLWERRSGAEAVRVGWGVLVARVVAVGLKVGAGVAILAVGGFAILF